MTACLQNREMKVVALQFAAAPADPFVSAVLDLEDFRCAKLIINDLGNAGGGFVPGNITEIATGNASNGSDLAPIAADESVCNGKRIINLEGLRHRYVRLTVTGLTAPGVLIEAVLSDARDSSAYDDGTTSCNITCTKQ